MISVIIPVYNRAHTLNRVVDSVLGQSYRDFELILVDDGSTDNSLELCRSYEALDARVKVFHTEHRGVSAARNLGIQKSSGAYIRFADSDDELPKTSLEDLIAPILENDSIELVVACLSGMGYDSIRGFESRLMSREAFLLQFFRVEYQCLYRTPCNKLYLRSVVEANALLFDETMSYSEDTHFNFRYYSCINNIYLSNHIVYYVHNSKGEAGHLSDNYFQNVGNIISHSLMLFGIYTNATKDITPDYRKLCTSLLMDLLWNNMGLIYRCRDYPIMKREICSRDWADLLSECPVETYFWGYRFLYRCLVRKKTVRLFWFFLIKNQIRELTHNNAKWVWERLVKPCRRDYGQLLEGGEK